MVRGSSQWLEDGHRCRFGKSVLLWLEDGHRCRFGKSVLQWLEDGHRCKFDKSVLQWLEHGHRCRFGKSVLQWLEDGHRCRLNLIGYSSTVSGSCNPGRLYSQPIVRLSGLYFTCPLYLFPHSLFFLTLLAFFLRFFVFFVHSC